MKDFKKVIRHTNVLINQVVIFELFLTSLIFFLISCLLFLILKISPGYSLIPSIIFFTIMSILKIRENKIKKIEDLYPKMNEKLRTGADFAESDGVVINNLHREIMVQLKYVELSSFLNIKNSTLKIAGILLLSFLVIFLSSLNFYIVDAPKKANELLRDVSEFSVNDNVVAEVLGFKNKKDCKPMWVCNAWSECDESQNRMRSCNDIRGCNTSENKPAEKMSCLETDEEINHSKSDVNEDIFGENVVAKLGDNELNVEINPKIIELNLGDVSDTGEADYDNLFLDESETFKEDHSQLTSDEKVLVKEYFKKIKSN